MDGGGGRMFSELFYVQPLRLRTKPKASPYKGDWLCTRSRVYDCRTFLVTEEKLKTARCKFFLTGRVV